MSAYKCQPKITFPTTLKINWLALKNDISSSRLSQLYPLINKVKKKSIEVSYFVSIHLTFSNLQHRFLGHLKVFLKILNFTER